MGLKIHVLQSDYLDYCSAEEVTTCTTYNAQHFANLGAVELSTSGKAFLIIRDIFPERLKRVASWFYRRLAQRGVSLPIPDPSGIWGDMNAINSVIAARMIAHDLSAAKPGNAYFIHILLPHFPFVTDSRCRILPVDMWRDRTNEAIPQRTSPRGLRKPSTVHDVARHGH